MNPLELVRSLWEGAADLLLGFNRCAGISRRSEPELPPDIEELLEKFRTTDEASALLEAGRQAFAELGKIPAFLHWNEGLRQALYDLILQTVVQSERFGDHNGALKRRFAVDLVTRVLREYEPSNLFELVEDVTIQPYVGVLIDWSVEVLNFHDAWPPVKHVKIPGFFSGRYGSLLRVQGWIWRAVTMVRDFSVFPSAYERDVRDALAKLNPQIRALKQVLPPSVLRRDLEEVASIIAQVGHLTAPHVRIASSLLRLAATIAAETPERRRQLAYAVMKTLLRRAYGDNWLALTVLDSAIGDFMIREMMRSTEWVLARNGLLP